MDTAKITISERDRAAREVADFSILNLEANTLDRFSECGRLLLLNRVDLWTPSECEDFVARGWRSLRSGEVPRISTVVRPADYIHDLKRGSAVFHPDFKNYSYLVVTIPDGALIRECNFTQNVPGTLAITGERITFERCNLTNNAVRPDWDVKKSNNAQAWFVNDGTRERRQWVCDRVELLGERERVPPRNAVLERNF